MIRKPMCILGIAVVLSTLSLLARPTPAAAEHNPYQGNAMVGGGPGGFINVDFGGYGYPDDHWQYHRREARRHRNLHGELDYDHDLWHYENEGRCDPWYGPEHRELHRELGRDHRDFHREERHRHFHYHNDYDY